jgi:hypothetical protein
MRKIAEARTDPADLFSAAVDALVRHRFELPALIALRRLAGTVHSDVNAMQWQRVGASTTEKQRLALEALLVVDPATQDSPFGGRVLFMVLILRVLPTTPKSGFAG